MRSQDKAILLGIFNQNHQNDLFYLQNKAKEHLLEKKRKNTIPAFSKQSQGPRKSIITLKMSELKDTLAIYDWRATTVYPIVVSRWMGVQFNQNEGLIDNIIQINKRLDKYYSEHSETVHLSVETQTVTPLETYQPLTFSQFLHCVKQSLIGFERLFNLFGPFQVNSASIVLNQQGKIKVWLASPYDKNRTNENRSQISEQQFVMKLKIIYSQFLSDNSSKREFFQYLQEVYTFLDFIHFLQTYIEAKKIKINKQISKNHFYMSRRNLLSPENKDKINKNPIQDKRMLVKCKSKQIITQKLPRMTLSPSHSFPLRINQKLDNSTESTLPNSNKYASQSIQNIQLQSYFRICNEESNSHNKVKKSQIFTNGQTFSVNNLYTLAPSSNNYKENLERSFNRLFDDQKSNKLSVSIDMREGNNDLNHCSLQKSPEKFERLKFYGRQVTESRNSHDHRQIQ